MKTIITNIFNAVYNNLISGGAYYLIVKGIAVTFLMTILAWTIATLVGVGVSYLMCYEKKTASDIGRALCFIFRSVPVLLAVWLLYYCIFGGASGGGIMAVSAGIGLWGAGHLSEIMAEAVKREQKRLSAGIREKLETVYYSTVAPQAIEDSWFHLKRLAVHIMQWTTVAGYIAVNDLTEIMYGIGHRTMYPFFSIFFAAICYMLATVLIEWAFKLVAKYVFDK